MTGGNDISATTIRRWRGERGRLVWISAARPGCANHITAARRDRILAHLRAAGLGAISDLGFLGRDDDGDDPVVVTGGQPGPSRRRRPRRTRPRTSVTGPGSAE
nr:hypothetical protein OG513_32290 [Streptomyces sp. NBC_00998]